MLIPTRKIFRRAGVVVVCVWFFVCVCVCVFGGGGVASFFNSSFTVLGCGL